MVLAKGLRPLQVVSLIFFVRVVSVFVVRTWYVPDEYWQTLEVAHRQAFGYGDLTWEWQKGIRSYLYPSVVAALFKLLEFVGLDHPEALVILPRILQAAFSSAADYSFYKWTGRRKWALFLILTSWFWFYMATRTLLQTVETAIVTIAFSLFPFKDGKLGYYDQESTAWIWLAVLCMFLRPTSAPLWIVLGAYNLLTTNQERLQLITRTYIPIGLITGTALVALDSYCYGRFIITPWEFFRFNVLEDIASFYGEHPWYWYITEGLPAVLGIAVLPVLWATYNIVRRPKEHKLGLLLLAAIAAYLAVFSAIPHKEFRFVLPLVPIFLYLAQEVIVSWSWKAKKWQLYIVAAAILLGNAVPVVYFGWTHQSGPMQLMPLVRDSVPNNRSSIVFLLPCHSAPFYSHLHMNVSARYLTCSPFPPPGETHETDTFFNNPEHWWRKEYSDKQTPTIVVIYNMHAGTLENVLGGYKLLHEVPHTEMPEGETGLNFQIYRKSQSAPKPRADDTV